MLIKQEIEDITIEDVGVELNEVHLKYLNENVEAYTKNCPGTSTSNPPSNEIKNLKHYIPPKDVMDILYFFEKEENDAENDEEGQNKPQSISFENNETKDTYKPICSDRVAKIFLQTSEDQKDKVENSQPPNKTKTVQKYLPSTLVQVVPTTFQNSESDDTEIELKPEPVEFNVQQSRYPNNDFCDTVPGKCPINCGQKICYDHYFSTDYSEWKKLHGNMVSQLGHMFSENNQVSSDEDEDAIHAQVNKMRMRNGLAPIDSRRKSKVKTKSQQLDQASSHRGDSNRSSPTDDLVIDESAGDTTDTDSVVSISSAKSNGKLILNKRLYAKRTRNDAEQDLQPSDSSSETNGIKVLRVSSNNFLIVTNENGSRQPLSTSSRSSPRSTGPNSNVNSENTTNNIETGDSNSNANRENQTADTERNNNSSEATNIVTCKTEPFQQIVNTIENIKKEIVEDHKRIPPILNKKETSSNSNQQPPPNTVFQCIPCKMQFESHLDLKKHILSVHIRVYQCRRCPFRTMMPFQFQKHLQTHTSRACSSESNDSLSPLRIKQLSSSSRSSSPIEIMEIVE